MTSEVTPGSLRLNTQLGQAPTRADVDALMKRCQIGVGGRNALDAAHSIMAECYGTLGRQQIEIERLRDALSVAYGLAPYYISGPYPTDGGWAMCELQTGRVVHRVPGPNA